MTTLELGQSPLRRARTMIRAAELAGYTRQDRARLFDDAQGYIRESISPKASERAYPEAVVALLGMLSGDPSVDGRLVLSMAKGMYEFACWMEDRSDQTLRPEEARLCSYLSLLLEQALHDGSMTSLPSEHAGVLAFFSNRLAKLRMLPGGREQILGFDSKRFIQLMQQVDTFAERYYSTQYVDDALARIADRCDAFIEHVRSERLYYNRIDRDASLVMGGLRLEEDRLRRVRSHMPKIAADYAASRSALFANLSEGRTIGLYVLKDMLVGADVCHEQQSIFPERTLFTWDTLPARTIATHQFADITHPETSRPTRDSVCRYSFVHFMPDHIPFSVALTAYQESRAQRHSER